MTQTTQLGQAAETRVAEYLEGRSYKILGRNVRTRYYEIDIIAQKNNTIIFTEVKYRKLAAFGGGEAAINVSKRARMINAASMWLADHSAYAAMQPRIDVLTVDGSSGDIVHYENAIQFDS